jgi:hypothetical protein
MHQKNIHQTESDDEDDPEPFKTEMINIDFPKNKAFFI